MFDISPFIDKSKVYTDPLRCLAWGTDAGFYRLVPKMVVRSENETQVSHILRQAWAAGVAVTFRAAGTSLAGQAITDSLLLVAGKNWERYKVSDDASEITLQPGIIGARVNEILKPYGRMFAPDPASKASAMVGGIIINNASGMNCGTHANSDKIIRSARIVLADGTVVDTAADRTRPRADLHPTVRRLIADIEAIRDEIKADSELCERIRYKYSIKNVTGLNLLPFAVFTDPWDIITHVMVGSEGTLAFLSEATVATSHLYPSSASAMVYFSDMAEACRAVVALKKEAPVYSCELLDRKSLASVNDTTGPGLTALLIETRADSDEDIARQTAEITGVLSRFSTYKPVRFTSDPDEVGAMWKMRSGVFPAVGGTRPAGTTALIEDIAFHIDDLPDASVDLARLLVECGYDDACIYGHALEGNYHFIIAQSFDTQAEIDRYANLMRRIEQLVVDRYHGSLKAEHGTGRNMAPFVEKEWGEKAFRIMRRIKDAFDPKGILNPGVIFNDDPECYLRHLKPLPLTDPKVDRCIECGFCEVNCVSCGLTLSARQRIVAAREMSRLERSGENPAMLAELRRGFRYLGNETCAGDGLCSTSCPMGINTGDLIHDFRQAALPPSSAGYKIGDFAAAHLGAVCSAIKPVLGAAQIAHDILGDKATNVIGRALHDIGLPLWTASLPRPRFGKIPQTPPQMRKVVYFPSCINRTMGASADGKEEFSGDLINHVVHLCEKAGYEVIFPSDMKNLCCGMIWESKGMPDIADRKTAELDAALWEASEHGRWPVVCDQSPCLHRMRDHIKRVRLYETAEFIEDCLVPYLEFSPVDTPVAVHITCSTRRMGLAGKIVSLASRCSTRVLVPQEIGCCGFAGDKGFTHPELNAWGLRKLRSQVEAFGAVDGYSNSRTCEIGLSTNSGIPYKSIVYLVNQVTRPKTNNTSHDSHTINLEK